VLAATDAGEDPALLKQILALWKLTTLDELVRQANASPPPDFSSLVPLVLDRKGDTLARGVLERAGDELASLARNVIRRLFGAAGSVPLAMAGGVFRQSGIVRQVFYNGVIAEFPQATVQSEIVDAVNGALALARKAGR
jgi:N-acetylglucosamine kinase-like BadF-type ATPase